MNLTRDILGNDASNISAIPAWANNVTQNRNQNDVSQFKFFDQRSQMLAPGAHLDESNFNFETGENDQSRMMGATDLPGLEKRGNLADINQK